MTHNPQGLAPDYHARVVVPMVQHIRCPNACTEPCDYPDCRCHQPQAAEAATELGAEESETSAEARRSRALIWRLYLAALLVGIGWGVSALLPLVTR